MAKKSTSNLRSLGELKTLFSRALNRHCSSWCCDNDEEVQKIAEVMSLVMYDKVRCYADGLHFAGDLASEKVLRQFLKSLE